MAHSEVYCHLRERVFSRFGLDLKMDDFRSIANYIRNGSAEYLDDVMGGRKAYLLEFERSKIIWIFDTTLKLPVTAYTRGMWKSWNIRKQEGLEKAKLRRIRNARRAEAERRMAELVG